MKRWALLLLLLVVVPALGVDRRQFCRDVLQRFAPDGYAIIQRYDSTPWHYQVGSNGITQSHADFMDFVTAQDPAGMVAQLGVAVHEECHNYSRKMAWYYMEQQHLPYADSLAYPVDHGDGVLVRLTPTFPAAETVHLIPPALQKGRFKVYIGVDNPHQTTQQMGIYGLMDEFVAYAHELRTDVDTEGWYLANKAWLGSWAGGCQDAWTAHAEFELYLMAWLREAQQKHPDVYRQVLANAPLWQVFEHENAADVASMADFRQRQAAAGLPQPPEDPYLQALDAELRHYQDLLAAVRRN
ncbi:MAG: hypothetical protein ACYCW6_16580 [Candidatus Xenobia bacterium]